MSSVGQDTLRTRRTLEVDGRSYDYFSLEAAEAELGSLSRLPISLKVLLENLLRFEDGHSVTVDDIKAVAEWLQERRSSREIAYRPARVLMQDFTGVPAVVDLAAMRQAMSDMGGDPKVINPLTPVDLVIDHSVTVDSFASPDAFERNVELEFKRNGERYAFLRWGQNAFDNFRVVPPGTGICHQVNLEYLGQVVWTDAAGNGATLAYPDTVVGTDSHTTMVNGLAILGWGAGGIEAEAAMLGQPISMLIPEVVGVRMQGRLREGATATDLVLTVVQKLRAMGVVGKFVEFYGPGLDHLSLADRATIANMAPEYGATCGYFPIDSETIRYLDFTGRDPERVRLVEAYAKAQGMWRQAGAPEPSFTDILELDLATVEPSLAGPSRPQDRVRLSEAAVAFEGFLAGELGLEPTGAAADMTDEGPANADLEPHDSHAAVAVEGADYALDHGAVVIAAITSCTNTSNPYVMIGAGLVARRARALGLTVKPWVKTSLAPGSQVVSEYLERSGLQDDLDALGFNLVGYGCTTCIGNSGPLSPPIAKAIETGNLVACSVLSGNRNFEGRISPHVRANYLASPPLVVAYALAGTMRFRITDDPIGTDRQGHPVTLKDIWPGNAEIRETVDRVLTPDMYRKRYGDVFRGPEEWRRIETPDSVTYDWDPASTYVKHPPFFEGMARQPAGLGDIKGARLLVVLGDNVTTDHISPAGSIMKDSPAGAYLTSHAVARADFNSYGARRGNHEVLMRGTFANIRIRNEMLPGVEGGFTKYAPDGERMTIYDAAMKYRAAGVPLVVVGGKSYGMGSSRDWAAKGPLLLGVKAVIVEDFERIHRSNLIGMGVVPLQFMPGTDRKTLGLDGTESFDITGIAGGITPRMEVTMTVHRADGRTDTVPLVCCIDTEDEVEYFRHGGILHYVLRRLAQPAA